MTTQLTPEGRAWAERNAATSIVANVALHGDGWPLAFVETSRAVANEEGWIEATDPLLGEGYQDEEYPDWEIGDPVPDGFRVYDGNAEDGPCEPYIEPIEYAECEKHGRQEVVGHLVYGAPFDPTAASKLACGCVVF